MLSLTDKKRTVLLAMHKQRGWKLAGVVAKEMEELPTAIGATMLSLAQDGLLDFRWRWIGLKDRQQKRQREYKLTAEGKRMIGILMRAKEVRDG